MDLLSLIAAREAKVGTIGLGYVGLPLAMTFTQAGFHVTGFDTDSDRVAALNAGTNHIPDVSDITLAEALRTGSFRATTDFTQLASADCISICVPTPLSKTRDPDVSYVIEAASAVARALRPGQLIVLESTVYPGTTTELLLPIFEHTGLRVGEDFFLAFSPERVDPGNQRFNFRNTPKVLGGITARCTEVASQFYGAIVNHLVPVSSTETAELTKLLENTFRAVNIGLVNELAQMASVLGVDVWEVIDAASTKPFGFMPFYPGPGLGGHCIPIDPEYLAWKLRSLNYRARLIEVASAINTEMPRFVVDQIASALNDERKCLNGATVVILGVAYKRDVGDVRESPILDVIELLQEKRAHVVYADPYVPALKLTGGSCVAAELTEDLLHSADCVVVGTDHGGVDYEWVVRESALVLDTRNATGHLEPSSHVWKLGGARRAGRQEVPIG